MGRAKAFASSQGPPLWVFLGSCLDSAGSVKCTFLVRVTQQATGLQTLSPKPQVSQKGDSELGPSSTNNHRALSLQVVCPASSLGTLAFHTRNCGQLTRPMIPAYNCTYVGETYMCVTRRRQRPGWVGGWEGQQDTAKDSAQGGAVVSRGEGGVPV